MAEAVVKDHEGALVIVYQFNKSKTHCKVCRVLCTVGQMVGVMLHAVVIVGHFKVGRQSDGGISAAACRFKISAGKLGKLGRDGRLHVVAGFFKNFYRKRKGAVLCVCLVKAAFGDFKAARYDGRTFALCFKGGAALFKVGHCGGQRLYSRLGERKLTLGLGSVALRRLRF